MCTLIYKHNYHNGKPDLKLSKLDLLKYDIDEQEFIIAAIEYTKTAAGKIVIGSNDGDIYADVEINVGLFSGSRKEKFTNLAEKSQDFLILPVGGKYKARLNIRFCLKHSTKKIIKWLNE